MIAIPLTLEDLLEVIVMAIFLMFTIAILITSPIGCHHLNRRTRNLKREDMSIEIENPKTIAEKIDAAANLVEQMMLSHAIKDEAHFKYAHKKAGSLLFDALRQMEDDQYTGVGLIAIERLEQINKHGRTIERDNKENSAEQLATGAEMLLAMSHEEGIDPQTFPDGWDHDICQHMLGKPYKERLIIAGA